VLTNKRGVDNIVRRGTQLKVYNDKRIIAIPIILSIEWNFCRTAVRFHEKCSAVLTFIGTPIKYTSYFNILT